VADNVLNEFWTTEAMWPAEGAGFVFLARAMHEIGRKRFGAGWAGDEPWAAQRNESPVPGLPDALERWANVRNTTVGLFKTGSLSFFVAEVPAGVPKAVGATKTLEYWFARAADLGERFGKCQIDLQHPLAQITFQATGDIVKEARHGRSTDFRWMYVDRQSLNRSLSQVEAIATTTPQLVDGKALPDKQKRRKRVLSPEARAIEAWLTEVHERSHPDMSDAEIARAVVKWVKADQQRRASFSIGKLGTITVTRYFVRQGAV
jgi:hypothetical protein